MLDVSHIAVIVDLEQESHHALMRAVDISKLFAAKITLVTSVYRNDINFTRLPVPGEETTPVEDSTDFYMQQLMALANDIQVDTDIEFKVVWHKNLYQGLLDYINDSDVDLVLKTAHKHSTLEKLLTPTDWHLLRETEIPVLFVKQGRWPSQSNVIGAINIEADSAHQSLNRDIIESTVKLADMCGGNPHLINVFPWPVIDFGQLKHLIKREDHFSKVSDTHKKLLMGYVKEHPIREEWIHQAEGLTPQECIPDIISASRSDLLVIGTVRRNGLQGMTIGNTTEKILDDIRCEVLALK